MLLLPDGLAVRRLDGRPIMRQVAGAPGALAPPTGPKCWLQRSHPAPGSRQTRGVVTMVPLDDADVSTRGLCEGPSPRRYAQVIGRLRVSTGGDETARRRRST